MPSTSRRKVKTGCLTCKKRRVKCDEGWPACRKCLSTGRVCDGYGVWGGGSNAHGSVERPASSLLPPRPGVHQAQLSQSVPTSLTQMPSLRGSKESLAFEFFWHRTTIKLIGIFESVFWRTLVLQACSCEPTVLHAVTAAGAAHRKQEDLALREYNKALGHLGHNLRGQDKQTTRLALTACLIFICLELLRGEFQAGHVHLQNGLRLLREHLGHEGSFDNPKNRFLTLGSPDNSTDDHLVEAFTPLNMQCALFGMSHSFLVQKGDDLARHMPTRFKSLREARSHLYKLINAVDYISAHGNQEFLTRGEISPSLILRRENIDFALILWKRAFDSEYGSLNPGDALSTIASRVLSAYHALIALRAATCLRGADETVFDEHSPIFITMLDHLKDIWERSTQHVERSAAGGINHTTFTMDLGFIPPLYFTALKCRVSSIRHRAVSLLATTSHREGIWDGYLVARIAKRVVQLEEGTWASNEPHAHDLASILPPSSRINDVQVLPLNVGSTTKAKLIIKRYKAEEGAYTLESTTEEVDISNDGPPPDYPLSAVAQPSTCVKEYTSGVIW